MTLKEYQKTLATKIVSAATLFMNEQGDMLIMNATYKDSWILPGGSVEMNESPHEAAVRETKEELGLDIPALRFLAISYKSENAERLEELNFFYYGGVLNEQQISSIKLQEEEVSEYKFIPPNDALPMLGEYTRSVVPLCLEAIKSGVPFYLENSEEVK